MILGLGRSPGEGEGYSPQYSGLKNSMDCIVHRVIKSQTKSWTLLSDFHFHFQGVEKRRLASDSLIYLHMKII